MICHSEVYYSNVKYKLEYDIIQRNMRSSAGEGQTFLPPRAAILCTACLLGCVCARVFSPCRFDDYCSYASYLVSENPISRDP